MVIRTWQNPIWRTAICNQIAALAGPKVDPEYTFAVSLLAYLFQGPQICLNFLYAIVVRPYIILWSFPSATVYNKCLQLANRFQVHDECLLSLNSPGSMISCGSHENSPTSTLTGWVTETYSWSGLTSFIADKFSVGLLALTNSQYTRSIHARYHDEPSHCSTSLSWWSFKRHHCCFLLTIKKL